MNIIKNYEYNKNIIINDNEIDLSHLKPFIKTFYIDNKAFKVGFRISSHVFSKSTDSINYNIKDESNFFSKNNNRNFDIDRYNQSIKLVQFINGKFCPEWEINVGAKRSNNPKSDDFFVIWRNYHIFIQFRKKSKYTEIFISSAYEKTPKQEARKIRGKPQKYILMDKLLKTRGQ